MSQRNNPYLVIKIIGKSSRKHAGEKVKSRCYAIDKLNIISIFTLGWTLFVPLTPTDKNTHTFS